MKKSILLFTLLLSVFLSAGAQDDISPVSMVSYEQRWLDDHGTIALKNNTQEEITRVNFQITYLDMNDNQVDYKDFNKSISIAPGMVKKVDIPAYEHERYYHYYKTKNSLGNPTFKIRYKYLGHKNKGTYLMPQKPAVKERAIEKPTETIERPTRQEEIPTIAEEEAPLLEDEDVPQTEEEADSEEDVYSSLSDYIVYLWLPLSLIVVFYIIVALMAQHRNRNAISWLILSIVITPFVAAFLLFVMGTRNKISFDYGEREQKN